MLDHELPEDEPEYAPMISCVCFAAIGLIVVVAVAVQLLGG